MRASRRIFFSPQILVTEREQRIKIATDFNVHGVGIKRKGPRFDAAGNPADFNLP